jgi:hypothetical protein
MTTRRARTSSAAAPPLLGSFDPVDALDAFLLRGGDLTAFDMKVIARPTRCR